MSIVLNRFNKSLLYSVNTPDYPDSTWIVNPDLSSVEGQPARYWKITGDVVSLMNQSERDATDAVILPDVKKARKTYVQDHADAIIVTQGYTLDMQRSFQVMYSDGLRMRPNQMGYTQTWVNWIRTVDTHVKTKQALIDAQTTVDGVETIDVDTTAITSSDPNLTVSSALDRTDSTSLESFLDGNAAVTDPYTGIIGPFYLMQELVNRRELFNDSTNPLYVADHTAILGANGYLVDHANRILNMETIHQKLGWCYQQGTEALYHRPKDVLFYYGWINSFNSAVNGWDNEKVALDMAKYNVIVFGDGVEDPTHGDYANTQVVIARLKVLNPNCLIFGYVALAQSLANFQTKVGQWNTLAVHGIFIDEAGYDYGKTRAEFNTCVDYVHGQTYANLCFANAWNTDHVIGTANDVSYPNSTYNDSSAASHLGVDDWILLESFPVNTTAYAGSGNKGYESKTDWLFRGQKAASLRATYGQNYAAINIIDNSTAAADGTALSNFAFISSMAFNLEGHGTSDTGYGAGSAAVKWWIRPDVAGMGQIYSLYPSVSVSTSDSDVYYRSVENARLLLDFSPSDAQTSSITKY